MNRIYCLAGRNNYCVLQTNNSSNKRLQKLQPGERTGSTFKGEYQSTYYKIQNFQNTCSFNDGQQVKKIGLAQWYNT